MQLNRGGSFIEKIALNITEAAELLGLSRPTVYELIHREDFPAFKVGKRTLISRRGLEEWVESQINCVFKED